MLFKKTVKVTSTGGAFAISKATFPAMSKGGGIFIHHIRFGISTDMTDELGGLGGDVCVFALAKEEVASMLDVLDNRCLLYWNVGVARDYLGTDGMSCAVFMFDMLNFKYPIRLTEKDLYLIIDCLSETYAFTVWMEIWFTTTKIGMTSEMKDRRLIDRG